MSRKSILLLFLFCWLALSQFSLGALVVINETFDLSTIGFSSISQNTLSTPVQIGVGDQVQINASFLPGQYLRFDDDPGGEILRMSLFGPFAPSASTPFSFDVSNVAVTFQGLQGTPIPFPATQTQGSLGLQTLNVESLTSPPNNYLAPGEFTIISGLTLTYDVDQMTQDPETFDTVSLLAINGQLVVPEPTGFALFGLIGVATAAVGWTRKRFAFLG